MTEQISDSLCPLCGSLEIWVNGWPSCACDKNLRRKLTVREAAPYLHLTQSCLRHWINDGEIPAIRGSHPLQVWMISLKYHRAAGHAYVEHFYNKKENK